MLPFEFIIDGPPVSQQARRKSRVRQWTNDVRRVARGYWPSGELPETGPVILSITYFYDTVSPDVDNIPKPIADGLKGLIFVDDTQITDCLSRKRNLTSELRIENLSSVLADGLSRGNEFLYIVVDTAPDQGVIY